MPWCAAGTLTSLNRALYALVRAGMLTSLSRALYALVRSWKAYLFECSLVCLGARLERLPL